MSLTLKTYQQRCLDELARYLRASSVGPEPARRGGWPTL